MVETRQVAYILPIILYEYLSTTQKFLSLFKAVSHHSIIEHVKSAGLIVQIKEIKISAIHPD